MWSVKYETVVDKDKFNEMSCQYSWSYYRYYISIVFFTIIIILI